MELLLISSGQVLLNVSRRFETVNAGESNCARVVLPIRLEIANMEDTVCLKG